MNLDLDGLKQQFAKELSTVSSLVELEAVERHFF